MAASSAVALKILLYFKQDLTEVFEKYKLDYTNEPSWVLEIHGLNEQERLVVGRKYDRLRSPPGDWQTGISPLIDFESGTESQFHDVSPFFITLNELGFTNDTGNPPANTEGMSTGQVREWTFTKVNPS